MPTDSPWPTIHAERKALAADVAGLTDEQWATPSLCHHWTVLQVLGHMTATAKTSPITFLTSLAAAGFRLTVMQDKAIAVQTDGGAAATLARFEAVTDSTTHPPGPVDTWLGETIVHAEDIRRPVGISHTYPTEAVISVADFYTKSNLIIGGKKRATGLRLRATDTDWAKGEGPEVAGPLLSLVLAITGRTAALSDLSGDGVEALTARCSE
jgi:uncharacterized protein (TIGR03083 family)